jgi:hypothetical protein
MQAVIGEDQISLVLARHTDWVIKLVQIRFFSWPIWPAHEAITDLKRLGKTVDEGHGLSRAVTGLRA